MVATVNVNGQLLDADHAVVSVFDHGFLYGEGVYETLRTYNGRPFLFDRHMTRLRASAAMLALTIPLDDRQLAHRVQQTTEAAGLGSSTPAYIRILVTRGVGDLTYDPAACPTPSVVVIVKALAEGSPSVYADGVAVVLVGIVRNHPLSVNPLIKSNNLLNPPTDAGLLPGVTREFVFEVGREHDIPVQEQALKDPDLLGADEAFLTSTTREIVPIVRVDGQPIGSGRPGPLTRALMEGFRQAALKR
jgi:branched-chain amino acid aminotransferase